MTNVVKTDIAKADIAKHVLPNPENIDTGSSLVPMLVWGLVLIVIGMTAVMVLV